MKDQKNRAKAGTDTNLNRVDYIDSIKVSFNMGEMTVEIHAPGSNRENSEDAAGNDQNYLYIMPLSVARSFRDALDETLNQVDEGSFSEKPVVSTPDREEIWENFEKLYGAWADTGMSDSWLEDLRDEWEERLNDLYEAE